MDFADRLVAPIKELIAATDQVSAGNLDVRVNIDRSHGDLGRLGAVFNNMTTELEQQQGRLIEANRLIDERREFTEAVLAGVPAAVLGVDSEGVVTVLNRSAEELLLATPEAGEGGGVGARVADAMPEIGPVLEDAAEAFPRAVQSQLTLKRGGGERIFNIRITSARGKENHPNFVVTLDDITDLVTAQRTSAWADVARRIAHEIKNPLTPIQLSAERLKRKYLKEIASDPETFKTCTDTIVRQVGDIGRMVDEFSAFARMPSPVMKAENLAELCHHAIHLQKHARHDVEFALKLPPGDLKLPCDARQVAQALTNLLQNALDAIDGREAAPGKALPPGRVELAVDRQPRSVVVAVSDNGRGLPAEGRERLTEPYVTTRTKGTGLGLAIVKKIMEDHGGDLRLGDNPGGGAVVTLEFPVRSDAGAPTDRKTEPGEAGPMAMKPQAVAHGA
jgi:two-component system nitrogen regulation sensor histidine kinase NtrY